jgi:hypothetical protein
MIFKAIQLAFTAIIPKFSEDAYKYLTKKIPQLRLPTNILPFYQPVADHTKYSEKQIEEIIAMWKSWQDNKRLYTNQTTFAEAVNLRFGTSKAKATIINLIKKRL